MGKNKRGEKEFSKEKKLIHENQRLKRELSTLRKQLARIDLDRYDQVREIIEEHYSRDRFQDGQEILDKMKEEWKCRECSSGYMEIILFNKVNNTYYHRKCTDCPNRTKSQKYTTEVKGILKKTDSEKDDLHG